jgi:hypothetical protein
VGIPAAVCFGSVLSIINHIFLYIFTHCFRWHATYNLNRCICVDSKAHLFVSRSRTRRALLQEYTDLSPNTINCFSLSLNISLRCCLIIDRCSCIYALRSLYLYSPGLYSNSSPNRFRGRLQEISFIALGRFTQKIRVYPW